MKTTESSSGIHINVRARLRQGMHQRYLVAGISMLIVIALSMMYWMFQQSDATAGVKPAMKGYAAREEVTKAFSIDAHIVISDNVPVVKWEGEYPAGSMFILERAENGKEFELVQKVPKEDVMLSADQYRFIDPEAGGGVVKYRITCVDNTDKTLATEEVSATMPESAYQFLMITGIEPIPFNNQFVVNFEAKKEEVISFEILNYEGTPLYSEVYSVRPGNNLIGFTRGDIIPSGVYIIRLKGSGDAIATTKLIKQS